MKSVYEYFVASNFTTENDILDGEKVVIPGVFEYAGDIEDWPNGEAPKMLRVTVEVVEAPTCNFCGGVIDGTLDMSTRRMTMHSRCARMERAEYDNDAKKDGGL